MHYDNAAKHCNVDKDLLAYLKECNTVVRFNITTKRDDGTLEVIPCYRAHHNIHKLPVKGGTRYAENVDFQVILKKYPSNL